MAALVFVVGCVLASFYVCIFTRLLKNEKIVLDRSKCDNCNHILSFFDLIPILSYVFLLGKCRYCKKKISPLSFVCEIGLGLLFLVGYYMFGKSYELLIYMIITSLMIIIYVTDFKEFIIFDSPLVGSALIVLVILYFMDKSLIIFRLISALGLFAVMYLIKILGDVMFKKESLGGGDIKLAFVMGLILGFNLGLCALVLSAFIALPYSVAYLYLKKNNEVAFGPFLASSLFIVFIFADKFEALLSLL